MVKRAEFLDLIVTIKKMWRILVLVWGLLLSIQTSTAQNPPSPVPVPSYAANRDELITFRKSEKDDDNCNPALEMKVMKYLRYQHLSKDEIKGFKDFENEEKKLDAEWKEFERDARKTKFCKLDYTCDEKSKKCVKCFNTDSKSLDPLLEDEENYYQCWRKAPHSPPSSASTSTLALALLTLSLFNVFHQLMK